MSLRDRLRSRRPDEGGEGGEVGPTGEAPPDPIDFRPRTDGSYQAGDAAGTGGLTLRFSPGSVQEAGADGDPDGPANGEYTTSGRFVVQRRFGRPIVYTVLEVTDAGFTARRTDTNPGGGATVPTFRFEPHSGG